MSKHEKKSKDEVAEVEQPVVAEGEAPESEPPKKEEKPKKLRVRATALGFFDHERKKPGTVFEIREKKGLKKDPITDKLAEHVFTVEEQFSSNWMEKVEDDVPLGYVPPPEEEAKKKALSEHGKKETKKATGDAAVI